MRSIKPRLKYLVAIVSLITVIQQHVLADGFPVRPKTLLINPSISYFVATKYWDSLRVLRPFQQNGKFTAVTTSLFAE
ncbi:MAG: hypothetical protein JSU01_12510, partial [Bacteroidetes bacterium]|nr:hypothetical protein [Bacteroidota bacterium]